MSVLCKHKIHTTYFALSSPARDDDQAKAAPNRAAQKVQFRIMITTHERSDANGN
jgi:hypothetical protein